MKTKWLILFCSLTWSLCFAQQNRIDSLKLAFEHAGTDSSRYLLLEKLSKAYSDYKNDSSMYYAEHQIAIAQKNNWQLAFASGLINKGYLQMIFDRNSESYRTLKKAFEILENPANESQECFPASDGNPHSLRLNRLGTLHLIFGLLMGRVNKFDAQMFHYREGKYFAKKTNDNQLLGSIHMNLGVFYFYTSNKLDSALEQSQKALIYFDKANFKKWLGLNYYILGSIFSQKKEYRLAIEYFHKDIEISKKENNLYMLFGAYHALADFYIKDGNRDSSIFFAQKMGELLRLYPNALREGAAEQCYIFLSKSYELNNQTDSAFQYLKLAAISTDYTHQNQIKNLTNVQGLLFEEMLRAEQLEKERAALQSRIRQFALFGGLGAVLLVAFFLYRNNRQKQKANHLLNDEKAILESTLKELKDTQTQLIQSEKLASLGELTAGIAHEIQNPLNFVNNFAEVSAEMLGEMEEELAKGDTQEAKAIAADLKANLEKINHHGKRASGIVKSMLEHSRTSTGTKEPTDLNALADEYLRLAYHGLRAKDSNFNADYELVAAPDLPQVNVVPQDIGRVLLNLINNAFYVVAEKAKEAIEGYQPTVTISSRKLENSIEISVQDNGPGIPESIRDKIFQPFFTTKPTGQGTGLGLSLAYDIVVKGHGGTLEVESTEGIGTTFIVKLPFL